MNPPVPSNEKDRLKRLQYYDILDSMPESSFDDLTELAAKILQVPIVLVSLIDKDRQWFKSKVGIDVDQTPRDISFCQFAIMDNGMFEVNDAKLDDRFKDNPLVTGDPKIRFYAGSVLADEDGYNIGTLCAIDRQPRELSDEDKASLDAIGRTVMRIIKLRKDKFQVEQLSQAKDDFLANMSHEIRTPMNAIIGFNDLLSKTELTEKQRKNVDIVANASTTLLNILNNVLDFSKIESGQVELSLNVINLEDALKKITNLHLLSAKAKGLKLRFSYDLDIPINLVSDSTRLSQIFGNLLSNAVKFTESGSITFNVEAISQTDNEVLVKCEITDTGIGIEPEKLDKIFDRFSQAEASTTKLYGGTGLGLSISKELTNILGGTIEVSSTPGQGTCFTVILPIKIADQDDIANDFDSLQEINKHSKPLNGLSVLIAEDNEHNQILASTYLEKNGAKYDIVVNGKEAIEALKQNTYDILLLDLQMPVMDGIQATKIIRNEIKSNIPIIACSAFSTGKEKAKCLELQMDDYIAKPYTESALVMSLLKHSKQSRTDTKQNMPIEKTIVAFDQGQENISSIFDNISIRFGDEYLSKMLRIATDRFPSDLDKIQRALISNDSDTIRQVAHLLVGSLTTINLNRGADIARTLEVNAKDHNLIDCNKHFTQLNAYITQVVQAAESYLNEKA